MKLTTEEAGRQAAAAVDARDSAPGATVAVAACGDGSPPPVGITGVGDTQGCLDWLEGTFQALSVEQVLEVFSPAGVEPSEWVDLPCGRHGYAQGKARGEVRVYYAGAEGMGVHVVAAGQGVRQLEAEGIVTQWEGPEGFAMRLLGLGFNPSRVDAALDDRAGRVTAERVQAALDEWRCVSLFRAWSPAGQKRFKEGPPLGWGVYMGSASSDVRLRFYCKQSERIARGEVDPGPWVRVELQARDARALALLCGIAGEGLRYVAGVVARYVEFKEGGSGDTNRSRWAAAAWWSEFLGEVGKARLTVAKVARTLADVAEWVKRQVAPALALLMASPSHGAEWLGEVLALGQERLKPWQWARLLPAGGGCAG